MPIGTPTTIGNAFNANNTAVVNITTTAAIVAGDTVVVLVNIGGGSLSVTSVSDGTNTYTKAFRVTNTTAAGELWYCVAAAGVAVSSTLAVNLSGTSGTATVLANACQVSGVGIYDSTNSASQSASGSSGSVTTGALLTAPAIVFGCLALFNTGYTGAAGFTTINNFVPFSSSAVLAYEQIAAGTAPVTYTPTFPPSSFVAFAAVFYGPNVGTVGILGVATSEW